MLGENIAPVADSDTPTLIRQLDVATFADSLRELEKYAADVGYNYAQKCQEQAWVLEVETLGIPEIDIMGGEFYGRSVKLAVKVPRDQRTVGYDAGKTHWLTGAYKISGITHVVDSNEGYKTRLSLYKDPTQNYTG